MVARLTLDHVVEGSKSLRDRRNFKGANVYYNNYYKLLSRSEDTKVIYRSIHVYPSLQCNMNKK